MHVHEDSNHRRQAALFFSFLLISTLLHAQSGEEIDSYAAAETASYQATLSLLGLPEGEAAPLSLGSLAAITMERWALSGGLLYSVTGLPRYALRDLREMNVYPEAPQFLALRRPLSGTEALQLLSRGVSAFGDLPETGRPVPTTPPAEVREAAIYPIVDLTEALTARRRNEEDVAFSNELTLNLDGWAPNETVLESEFSVVSDEEDLLSPFIRELYVKNRLTPAAGGAITEISVGRREVADLTGRIISQPIDGFLLQRSGPTAVAVFGVGYTGLLREEQGPPPFTLTTREDAESEADRLAPATLFTQVRLLLPEFWERHSPSLELASRLDQRSFGDLDSGNDSLDLYLTTLGLSGPLGTRLFYDLSGTGQLGLYRTNRPDANRDATTVLAGLVRGSFRWFPQTSVPTRLALELLLASGDSEGAPLLEGQGDRINTSFLPAGGPAPWVTYPGTLSNLFHPRVSADLRLLEPLRLSVAGGPFFRVSQEPVATIPESALTRNLPLGAEISGEIAFEPVRELILELNSSIFVPWTREFGGVHFDSRDPVWETEATFTFAF